MVPPSERGRENYLINSDTLTAGSRGSHPAPVDMDDTITLALATLTLMIDVGNGGVAGRAGRGGRGGHTTSNTTNAAHNYRFRRKLQRRQNGDFP